MDHKLIAHITPTISLLADDRQYILVIRANPTQAIKNGYHTYHQTIGACFEEILSHVTRSNLSNDRDKSMKEIAETMEKTVQEIRRIFKPFEDLTISKKG